jgi:elongation factor Ts
MAITAQQVKALRDKTDAGMMDCKKALVECGGDEEKAVAWLREKGISKAAKKAGRATSEGAVTVAVSGDNKAAGMAELLCETDFVARNENFQEFADKLAMQVVATKPADLPSMPLDGKSAEEALKELVGLLGENMQLGRAVRFELSGDGGFGSYIHAGGKIGVLVEFSSSAPVHGKEPFENLAKDVAMQVAAANPLAVTQDQVPADAVEKEKAIYLTQAKEEGKPENIAEKIVEGRIKKFYKEIVLLDQPFIKDDKVSVGQLVDKAAGELGADLTVTRFARLAVGEQEPSQE